MPNMTTPPPSSRHTHAGKIQSNPAPKCRVATTHGRGRSLRAAWVWLSWAADRANMSTTYAVAFPVPMPLVYFVGLGRRQAREPYLRGILEERYRTLHFAREGVNEVEWLCKWDSDGLLLYSYCGTWGGLVCKLTWAVEDWSLYIR